MLTAQNLAKTHHAVSILHTHGIKTSIYESFSHTVKLKSSVFAKPNKHSCGKCHGAGPSETWGYWWGQPAPPRFWQNLLFQNVLDHYLPHPHSICRPSNGPSETRCCSKLIVPCPPHLYISYYSANSYFSTEHLLTFKRYGAFHN